MLTEHRILRVPTVDNQIIECEVNFSSNESVKDGKVVRFKIHNDYFDVKRDDLVALILAIGTVTDVEKLLPMKLTNVKKMERLLTFEWLASKDYKKGEKITVKAPWIDEVPTDQEISAGNLGARKKKVFDTVHKTVFKMK